MVRELEAHSYQPTSQLLTTRVKHNEVKRPFFHDGALRFPERVSPSNTTSSPTRGCPYFPSFLLQAFLLFDYYFYELEMRKMVHGASSNCISTFQTLLQTLSSSFFLSLSLSLSLFLFSLCVRVSNKRVVSWSCTISIDMFPLNEPKKE